MADDKTVNLRVDGSQGEQALQGIERAADGASEAMGGLAVEVEKTETQTKRLAGTSRDYNNAARSVGDSIQAITRFEAAYRASLNDTANSAQTRAQILAASFARTIGGVADEAKAVALLAVGHKDAASAVQFMLNNNARLPDEINKSAGSTRNFGAVAQQAGYQVADMANQIGNGTPIYIAAGQQMGQLLGIFGAWGAIAGAAISIAGPLAASLLSAGAAAKQAAADQKEYNDALREGEGLIRSQADVQTLQAERTRERALQARTDQYEKLQKEVADLELKRRENTAVTPGEFGNNDVSVLDAKEEARLTGLIGIKQRQLAELSGQVGALIDQNPRANEVSREVLGTGLEDLQGKRTALKSGMDDAAARGDAAALAQLTEAYGAVNRAIATYVTEGERAVLMAEAQAKAAGMGTVEGQRYLAQRQAEIGLMGKVVEVGEAEKTMAAARIAANTAAAKSYSDSNRTIATAAIDMQAKLAMASIDGERQALAQRKALGEIGAADELAQAVTIEDRKRAVEEDAAQAKLNVLRRSAGVERAEINAAENAITVLRAKHVLDRQKQVDEEAAARVKSARDMALIEAEASASRGTTGIAGKTEEVTFQKAMGRIDGGEEIAALREIADEKYRIELDLLNKKMELAGQEQAERVKLANQIVALEGRRTADMARLDRQETLNRLQEIRSVTAPFTQATSQMTQGFIQGTLRRDQIARQAAQSIALSYANMGVKVATDWLHTNVMMAAYDRLFGAQKVATAATVEAGKTGIKAAAAAKQAEIVAGGQAAEVGAVAAGETAKVGTIAAGEAAGTGIKAASASSNILIDAWEAMAGAYAAIAGIPVIGPVLAPIVAAGAFAAVAALASNVFSAEGGWDEVPHDGAPTLLHKKEMVLPAQFAVPLRRMLTDGGAPILGAASSAAALMAGRMSVPGAAGGAFALPQFGAADVQSQSWGLPDWLRKGPGFDASNSTTNNVTNRGGDVHFQQTVNVTGKVRTDDIENFEAATVRALAKAQRNGNVEANSIRGRKK